MNRTNVLDMNLAKNPDINLTRDLDNNHGFNLTRDLEGNRRINITQHLKLNSSSSTNSPALGDSIDFHNLPNLNSTQTLASDQNVQPEQMPTFGLERLQHLDDQTLSLGVTESFKDISHSSDTQSGGVSLQDQEEYSAQAPFNEAMSAKIVGQLGLSSTRTLNTTEPEAHTESAPEEAR